MISKKELVKYLLEESIGRNRLPLFLPYHDKIFQGCNQNHYKSLIAWIKRQPFVKVEKGREFFYPALAKKIFFGTPENVKTASEEKAVLSQKTQKNKEDKRINESTGTPKKNETESFLNEILKETWRIYNVLTHAYAERATLIVFKKQPKNCEVFFQTNQTSIFFGTQNFLFFDTLELLIRNKIAAPGRDFSENNQVVIPVLQDNEKFFVAFLADLQKNQISLQIKNENFDAFFQKEKECKKCLKYEKALMDISQKAQKLHELI